ncbi:MAG: 2-oxoacid:acceptor oxidoreductase family protein [bacterium]|nr:2-oxoacid:acceptor oxidoreductase family protein [bacterium]
MDKIIEITWHGRGGQGAKSASQILAEALLDIGKYAQSFPEYGAERAGAPMKAFNRIADRKLTIYANVEAPDIVVVIDPTLLSAINVVDGLKENGILLVNSSSSPDSIRSKHKYPDNIKVFSLDASRIAVETIGKDIPNTPMLGALSKVSGLITIKDLVEKFTEHFSHKLGEEVVKKNTEALDRGFKEVK